MGFPLSVLLGLMHLCPVAESAVTAYLAGQKPRSYAALACAELSYGSTLQCTTVGGWCILPATAGMDKTCSSMRQHCKHSNHNHQRSHILPTAGAGAYTSKRSSSCHSSLRLSVSAPKEGRRSQKGSRKSLTNQGTHHTLSCSRFSCIHTLSACCNIATLSDTLHWSCAKARSTVDQGCVGIGRSCRVWRLS